MINDIEAANHFEPEPKWHLDLSECSHTGRECVPALRL